jgi:Fe-S-cluster containining protein
MKAKPTASNRPVRRSPKPSRTTNKLRRSRELDAGVPGKTRDKRKPALRLPLYEAAELTQANKAPSCTACGLCCTYVAIEVDAPSTVKRATQLLWYLYHGGVSLYENADEWMVQFESTCQYLQPDHRCGIYATRPHICREFSAQDCEVNTGDDGHTFYTAAEFLLHLKQERPRVHSLVQKSFAPPDEPARTTPTPFERRMQAVHKRRAALGV